ncbi:CU044_2847 family protein [Actinokineospora sp. NPDC004072]
MGDHLQVRVETVEVDAAGGRQIAARGRASELLADRRGEVQDGIRAAVAMVRDAMAEERADGDGWRVSSIEATFGISLAAEAGVILTKASAEASFEVTLTIERG